MSLPVQGVTKEGAGRVAVFNATGIPHCYTLECNYNTGRLVNAKPNAKGDGRASPSREAERCVHLHGTAAGTRKRRAERSSSQEPRGCVRVRPGRRVSPKYSPEHWEEVGRGCVIALLDLDGNNPWSRLQRSEYRTVEGLRQYVERSVKTQRCVGGVGGPAGTSQAAHPCFCT